MRGTTIKPIQITESERDNILSIVTAPKARTVVHHMFDNPVSPWSDLEKLIGPSYASVIGNCISKRIQDLGLRMVSAEKKYHFIRFGVLPLVAPTAWPMCKKPVTNPVQRWISR